MIGWRELKRCWKYGLREGEKMKTKLALIFVACAALLCGCSSPAPSAPERFLFDVQTNTVPVVTNWVEALTVTNELGTVETRNFVTWATNIETRITYTVSTNGAAMSETASRLTNVFFPGFGELAAALLAGILGTWAKLRSTINKGKTASVVLAQGAELLLAIIETTPQGRELAPKLKLELAKNQISAGVVGEIARIVDNYVDNDAAKKAARMVLESLPQAA